MFASDAVSTLPIALTRLRGVPPNVRKAPTEAEPRIRCAFKNSRPFPFTVRREVAARRPGKYGCKG